MQFSKPNIKLSKKDYDRIKGVISSGWVSIGEYVQKLEFKFREKFNVRHAIACSSATQGLIIAMKAAGWRNKRIAVPSFTWPSTIYAIESNIGNKPVFCDVNRKTWLIEPKGDYDCIMSVDTFGSESCITSDKMESTDDIICDAAHSFGINNLGQRYLAEVVSLSFSKMVSASEGGVILTNNDNLADCAYELRRLSARMEEINAIIALKSFHDFDINQKMMTGHIAHYKRSLEFPFEEQTILFSTNNSNFPILVEPSIRESIVSALVENDIEYKIYYEPLVSGLKNTDDIYSRIISFPLYSGLDSKDIKKVCLIANEAALKSTPGVKYLRSDYLKEYIENEN